MFPKTLDMGRFITDDAAHVYDLRAILLHKGTRSALLVLVVFLSSL